jgi:BirA family biotin operon repressor/biotin-[acetyl-CoA-carboxylase] ligase
MFLHRFAELGSTQDWAIDAAQSGKLELAVMADRQTSGRGRGGRAWQAPEGNLSLSMLLRPGPVPLQAAAWSLLAGVAVFEAVAEQGVRGLQLKWPNDVMRGGAKLAGVLIDSALTPAGLVDWVVIGVGVNVAEAPALPDRATTCLAAAGGDVSPETLARSIVAQITRWRAAGHAAVKAAWLERAHPTGTRLRVHDGQRVVEGDFAGLAPDGSLMLRNEAAIPSGDVFLVGV